MTMRREIRWHTAVGAALLVLLAGCAGKSPKVTYYTLAPVSAAGTAAAEPLAIAVGPADFPKALDPVKMATRIGPNRIDYDEFHRWAGTLDADFVDVMAINLSRLLGTDRVVAYPAAAAFPVDYRVLFDVVRFESDPGGAVSLEARWVLEDDAGEAVDAGTFRTVQSAGDGYESRAAAHSAALGELATAVAGRIRARPSTD
jgi:uncharacterized lipoprotein YmbA